MLMLIGRNKLSSQDPGLDEFERIDGDAEEQEEGLGTG
jgi:hypothetical protein